MPKEAYSSVKFVTSDVFQIRSGVEANATDRVLLRSSKPFLHVNVDCNALVAAVVSRQVSIVHLFLKTGIRTDIKMRLGAWSWDLATGEVGFHRCILLCMFNDHNTWIWRCKLFN